MSDQYSWFPIVGAIVVLAEIDLGVHHCEETFYVGFSEQRIQKRTRRLPYTTGASFPFLMGITRAVVVKSPKRVELSL